MSEIGVAVGVLLAVLLLWLLTAGLVAVVLLLVRVDEHEARLDALERDDDPGDLGTLPPEVEPPRAPIGFRRE